jgi:hypothetical protein
VEPDSNGECTSDQTSKCLTMPVFGDNSMISQVDEQDNNELPGKFSSR